MKDVAVSSKRKSRVKKLAVLALFSALALGLSYLEFLLPPFFPSVPGVKLGLPNLLLLTVLYRYGIQSAAAVSAVRLVLSAVLFGNPVVFLYSLAGAVLSLLLMALLRLTDLFSPVGVSIVGGVSHNLAQILLATVLLETPLLGYTAVFLCLSGTVSGTLIGFGGSALLRFLEKKRLLP